MVFHIYFTNGQNAKYYLDEKNTAEFINNGTILKIKDHENDIALYLPIASIQCIIETSNEELDKELEKSAMDITDRFRNLFDDLFINK